MNEKDGVVDPGQLFKPQMNQELEETLANMSFLLWERESIARNELLRTIGKAGKTNPIEERELVFWTELHDGFRRFMDLHLWAMKKLNNLDAS